MKIIIGSVRKPIYVDLCNFLLLIYFMTISIEFVSTEINSLIQNIAYIGFIGLRLIAKNRNLKFSVNTFLTSYGIFLLYAATSILWSADMDNSVRLLRIFIKIFVMMFFVVDYFISSGRVDDFINILYISIIVTVLYVLINSTPEEWVYENLGKKNGIDTVRLAVRMVMGSYIGLYRWYKTRKLYDIVIGIMLLAISLSTGKRTGAIFVVVAYVVYNICVQKQYWKKLLKVVWLIVLLGLAWTAIMYIPALNETFGQRTMGFIDTLFHGEASDASTIERLQLLGFATTLFKNNFLFGSGLNGMRTYLSQIGFYHVTYAHNNYLEIATGLGVIGVILYYTIYLFPIIRAYRYTRFSKNTDVIFMMSFLISLMVSDLVQVTYESYFELVIICILSTLIYKNTDSMRSGSKIIGGEHKHKLVS